MKHFLLAIQQPDGGVPEPGVLEPIMRKVQAFNKELRDADCWVFAGGLQPPGAAVVVRLEEGEATVSEGPYVPGGEHIGGMTILKARDLKEALGWARKLARATTLPVELREFQGEMDEHLA
ncbi:hypothetical protein D477_018399 [Arthrobacter crystallopoietes BAB-32]|uniref:YCII-related domain-containing protein n=1 Tax=Arthrobacter crystallopoietes BAB-32 TaxID=1246476 RepID=N1UQW7_9MICC|nr:YciI family protein [Arthrobacter crystallopoietes]EMY32781.1 hypothetical protein D477_018399 [Arthrobacter crystallopoietes BAB-32]